MKKFLWFVICVVIGVGLALGSALNEGGTVGGAWAGVVYALVVAALVALFDNQALSKPWKEIGIDAAVIVGSSILGALCYTIF